jgi:branched-chain amino acid transport system permease protein
MDSGVLITDLLNGLSRGMLYFLMTSGLALTFSVLGIINFAHGSFIMLGAYMAFTLLQATGMAWAFFLIIILAAVVIGVIGVLVEMQLLRRIYQAEHLYQLLLTFALVLIFDGLVLEIWGGQPRSMILPKYVLGAVSIGGNPFPKYSLIILFVSALLTVGLWRFLYRTDFGKATRAAAMDREMTEALGKNVPVVFTGTFGIGIALAAFAGGLGLAMSSLTPGVGTQIVVLCFAVVVIGGMGSLWGALIAALILGLCESFGDHYFPQMAMALPFILMALILMLRPQGLFGKE